MKKYIAPRLKMIVISQMPLMAGSDTIDFTNQHGDNKKEVLSKRSDAFWNDEDYDE